MQLFDAIPSSLLRVDRSLNITAANKHFLEKSRRTAAETLGQPLTVYSGEGDRSFRRS